MNMNISWYLALNKVLCNSQVVITKYEKEEIKYIFYWDKNGKFNVWLLSSVSQKTSSVSQKDSSGETGWFPVSNWAGSTQGCHKCINVDIK